MSIEQSPLCSKHIFVQSKVDHHRNSDCQIDKDKHPAKVQTHRHQYNKRHPCLQNSSGTHIAPSEKQNTREQHGVPLHGAAIIDLVKKECRKGVTIRATEIVEQRPKKHRTMLELIIPPLLHSLVVTGSIGAALIRIQLPVTHRMTEAEVADLNVIGPQEIENRSVGATNAKMADKRQEPSDKRNRHPDDAHGEESRRCDVHRQRATERTNARTDIRHDAEGCRVPPKPTRSVRSCAQSAVRCETRLGTVHKTTRLLSPSHVSCSRSKSS